MTTETLTLLPQAAHDYWLKAGLRETAIGPVSDCAECALIGCCLFLTPEDVEFVAMGLEPEDFAHQSLGRLWEIITAQAKVRLPFDDPILIQDAMEQAGYGVGPIDKRWAYIYVSCESYCISPGNADHHAKIIRDLSIRRRAIRECKQAAHDFSEGDIEAIMQRMMDESERAIKRRMEQAKTSVADIAADVLTKAMLEADDRDSIAKWHLPKLDALTAGLHSGEFILLAARPSVGKSALSTQIAYHEAQQGKPVIIFSLEMNKHAVLKRIFSQFYKFNAERAAHNKFSTPELALFKEFLEEASTWPLWIEDTDGKDPRRAKVIVQERMARGAASPLVIFDHLQLAQWESKRHLTRYEVITAASGTLADMAHEFHIPVLGLSQMSRPERGKKESIPQLHELKESGSLEQDADTVIFLHRKRMHTSENAFIGLVDAHVAKQRNGTLGMAPLLFKGDFVTFCDKPPEARNYGARKEDPAPG